MTSQLPPATCKCGARYSPTPPPLPAEAVQADVPVMQLFGVAVVCMALTIVATQLLSRATPAPPLQHSPAPAATAGSESHQRPCDEAALLQQSAEELERRQQALADEIKKLSGRGLAG